MVSIQSQTLTPEAYLNQEEAAESRNQYINGERVPIAGGTTNHNEVVTHLCIGLKSILRKKGFKTYIENVKVWIETYQAFVYPDVMVIAGNPIYYEQRKTTVVNPLLIFEVLSDSTRNA